MIILVLSDIMVWGVTIFFIGYLTQLIGTHKSPPSGLVFYIGVFLMIIGIGVFAVGYVQNPQILINPNFGYYHLYYSVGIP